VCVCVWLIFKGAHVLCKCMWKIHFNTATFETPTNERISTSITLFSATVSVTGDTMFCFYMTTMLEYRYPSESIHESAKSPNPTEKSKNVLYRWPNCCQPYILCP
jgi:hypothetical protein